MSLLLLLLAGCAACRTSAPPTFEPPPPAPPPPVPAGEVKDGRYLDSELPFGMAIPPGWRADPGRLGDALRVVLREPDSGLTVEVWAWRDGTLGPRPREGCSWTFQDRGRYSVPAAEGAVVVATCSPDKDGGPRVFGWYLAHDAVIYALEGRVPDGEVGESLGQLDAVVGGLGWR